MLDVFWMPGCTACLQMKEFIEATDRPYREINIGVVSDAADRLRAIGATVPCVMDGSRWASGTDLRAVAALIGTDYVPPDLLAPAVLQRRYRSVIETLFRLVAQGERPTLHHRHPERDRTLLNIAYHAASAMRAFMQDYDPEGFEGEYYQFTLESPVPPDVRCAADVIGRAHDTLTRFNAWWSTYGSESPLDRLIPTYMGHRTSHEALDREVWHTAQHVRQMALFLAARGIVPDDPLIERQLAGLSVPDRVFT